MTEPMRILYFNLTLTDKSWMEDMEKVHALRFARPWFTHIGIIVRSSLELPYAATSTVVNAARNMCYYHKLKIIWGRWLWLGWPPKDATYPLPNHNSHFYAGYYATQLSRLAAEKDFLGAHLSWLDAEPYALSVQKEELKKRLTIVEQRNIKCAVWEAIQNAPRADFITPAGSMTDTHYSYPLMELAHHPCTQKTYKLKHADDSIPIKVPEGYTRRLNMWGSWVTPLTPLKDRLSIKEAKSIDLKRVQELYPENIGQWIYAGNDIPEVLEHWND